VVGLGKPPTKFRLGGAMKLSLNALLMEQIKELLPLNLGQGMPLTYLLALSPLPDSQPPPLQLQALFN